MVASPTGDVLMRRHTHRLPALGAKLTNKYAIEFVVEQHGHAPTVNTIGRIREQGPSDDDLYPVVSIRNLSDKLVQFIDQVMACTPKELAIFDTTPELRRDKGALEYHYINTIGHPDFVLLFIDAARVHETHLAHELGHAWIEFVEQAEDERVFREFSDGPRMNQLCFVQSFVLDLWVNEIIAEKGFDVDVIHVAHEESMASLGRAMEAGYRPETRREGVFMALALAADIVLKSTPTTNLPLPATSASEIVRQFDPELALLAAGMAKAVLENGYRSKAAVRKSIDACLLLAFEHSGDPIDLERDLIPPRGKTTEQDKRPHWLPGCSLALKCEVARLIAKEEIPSDAIYEMQRTASGPQITFRTPDGQSWGPFDLENPLPRVSPLAEIKRIQEINRHNRDRQMKPPSSQVSKLPGPPLQNQPVQSPLAPFIQPGHRPYMTGLAQFTTRVREAEWIGGEPPYAYAMGNPTTYIDPTGLAPCVEKDACEDHPHVPGWYDNHEGLKKAIGKAVKECPAYSPAVLKAIFFCLVARETRGAKTPWKGRDNLPDGPCQIWPGSDKDRICKGLDYKSKLEDHIRCCARILCDCLTRNGGDLVKGCGTTGHGRKRKGQWQVINESGPGMEPHFKCCLKAQGWENPVSVVPKPGREGATL